MDWNIAKNDDKFCDRSCSGCGGGELSPKGISYVRSDISPVVEPISLEIFKQHARIDFNIDDSLCNMYIRSARQYIENYCRISIVPKNVTLYANQLPDKYRVDFCPIISSTSEFFGVDTIKGVGGTYVEVNFIGGYDTEVPEDIKVAIARYAAGLYMNRENLTDGAGMIQEALLMVKPYKRPSF